MTIKELKDELNSIPEYLNDKTVEFYKINDDDAWTLRRFSLESTHAPVRIFADEYSSFAFYLEDTIQLTNKD